MLVLTSSAGGHRPSVAVSLTRFLLLPVGSWCCGGVLQCCSDIFLLAVLSVAAVSFNSVLRRCVSMLFDFDYCFSLGPDSLVLCSLFASGKPVYV